MPHPGEYLDACMKRAGLHAADYAIKLNDEFVCDGEEAFHLVRPGDRIVCSRAAAGGSLWKTVAMMGVMVAAAAITDGFALTVFGETLAFGGLGLSGVTAGIVSSAIGIGGNMLVNAFMGGIGMGSANAASNTYDPTGPKTLTQAGTPIAKAYGTMGWAGQIISSFVDEDGKDQYLNLLASFGFGTATSNQSVLLNSKPVSSYPDLVTTLRYGTNDQTPMPGFDTVRNVYPQETEMLAASGAVLVVGTGTNTSGLQITVKFPGGLMRTDSGGNPKEVSLAYKVEVSPSGQNSWTTPIFPRTTTDAYTTDANGFRHYPYWVVMPTDRYAGSGLVYSTDTDEGAHTPGEKWTNTQSVKVYNVDNTNSTYDQTFEGEWQPTVGIQLDLQSVTDWWGGWRIVSNMTNQSFYDVVNVYGLAVGKWDCRVTKWGAGPHDQPIPQGDSYMTDPHYTADAWLWVVTEIQFTDLAYPNMILLGIRALATSQLSGADQNILATWVHDIGADTVLPSALATFEHDNPAIVAYDVIMNPLYGMASSDPNLAIDVPAFVRWAEWCDLTVPTSSGETARQFVFAGVFDANGTNAWTALNQIAQMSRAQIIRNGTTYSVWVDAPTDVTQVFTEANIVRDSYTEDFIAFDDRATLVEVEFADATRNWRTDLPVSVMTETTLNSGLQPKPVRVNLLGCTDRDQAWRWAYFNLLSTETLLKTCKFQAGIESVSCAVGSVIGIQQTQWSAGGRVQRGSTTTSLLIDRSDLPSFTAGAGWTVGVQHPVVTVGTATIQSVAALGNGAYLLTFSGDLPAGRMVHLVGAAGGEAQISGVTQSSGVNGNSLTMVNVQGSIAAGQTVTLYDFDRIELQAVSAVNGEAITVPGFSQAPTPDAPWFYAQTSGSAPYKTFRVQGVRKSGDLQVEISGIEYNPTIYVIPTPSYGEIVDVPTVNAAVTNLTLTEKLQYTTQANKVATQALITAGWDNGQNTRSVDVWASVDDGPMNRVAYQISPTGYSFAATTGDVWTIKVVGKDGSGTSSSFNDAPEQTITVQGTGAAPGTPTNFNGNLQANELILTWVAPTGTPAATTYEIRYNANSADTSWNDGVQVVSGFNALTYTIATPGSGVYMLKAMSSAYVESIKAATWSSVSSSSSLNSLGSLAPGQALEVDVASVDNASFEISVPAQTLQRTDGTTYTVPAGTLTYSGLAAGTTYYVYTTLRVSDATLHVAGAASATAGDPPTLPPTSGNASLALMACADGFFQGPQITITTATASGGVGKSGGGGAPSVCPEAREMVKTLERGPIAVRDLKEGEHVLGWCFEAHEKVWRRVARIAYAEAHTWYRVSGYLMSPLDPIWWDGEWRAPYEVGEYVGELGIRVRVEIASDRYDQRNFYLVGRNIDLLIHNTTIAPCTLD